MILDSGYPFVWRYFNFHLCFGLMRKPYFDRVLSGGLDPLLKFNPVLLNGDAELGKLIGNVLCGDRSKGLAFLPHLQGKAEGC